MKALLVVLYHLALESSLLAADRPNALFIHADELGYWDIGGHGGEIAPPNLDSLARDGLRFTRCYNTARCWPSRVVQSARYEFIYNCTPWIPYAPVDSTSGAGWQEMKAAHANGTLARSLAATERELRVALAEKMILDFDHLPLPRMSNGKFRLSK